MGDDRKRVLVLELLAQDVQTGLHAAVSDKRQELLQFVEGLWDKYALPLGDIIVGRDQSMIRLNCSLKELGYARWQDD